MSNVLSNIRFFVAAAIAIAVLVCAVVALVDASRRPERAFASEGKQTKKIWMLILGGGLLFAVLGAVGMISVVLNIVAIGPAAVYWYGVRPAIKPYGTGSGPSRPSGPTW